jgi:hypothetical protein
MKLAFLLLVLVNLLLFAWQQGTFGRFAERGREPERVARQIEPERIRVLTEKDVKALRERAQAPTSRAAPDLNGAQACVEFGDFAPGEVARAEKALAALAGARVAAHAVEGPGWFMVYLPSHKTAAEAERRAEELRGLGVRDLQVMSESAPLKFGIGLGSFRDAGAAKSHVAALEKLGVKGVRMSDRPSTVALTRFQLRDLDTPAAQQLGALRGEFPAQSVRPCPAG